MVKRTYQKNYNEEPEQSAFDKPSEREHCFQVVEIYTSDDALGQKLKLDADSVSVKCEVVGGEEEGRTLLQRLTLDENSKGFYATRLFLKSIGELYKGEGLSIDSDNWIGKLFYATVIHNGKYANISEYNFDKKIEQQYKTPVGETKQITDPKDIEW